MSFRSSFARRAAVVALVASSTMAARARAADDAPTSVTTVYSPYEIATIREAEATLGARLDADAEGKIVETIETVRLDPIEPRDPAPLFLNALHVTTKDHVVRHEVLLRVGAPYRKTIADESARNIRKFARMSVVLCVPLRGSRPDRVRLVVITKDVWTLLADADATVTRGGVEYLKLEVKENNFVGTQAELSTRAIILRESTAVGAGYTAPRFAGRFLTFHSEANVIFNRRSGQPEGSFGSARVERPLFATNTAWGWGTGVSWIEEVHRRYTNAEVAVFEEALPWIWRTRFIEQQTFATYSLGWARKNDFTIGLQLRRDQYRVPNATQYDAALVQRFVESTVPVGESRVSPYFQWRSYANDFLRIIDYETLSLQEDYRLGHDVVVRGYPVIAALGSTRNVFGLRAGAMYTVALGDGMARVLVDSTTEMETTRIADAQLTGELRIVSPRTGLGRLVFDTWATNRWRNYLNRVTEAGGEDRFRGWPTRYFVGRNVFAMNLEFRTRPVEIASVHIGGAAFYDVGRAFNSAFDEMRPVHSVGVGVRLALPQVDRNVIRADVGFPIAASGLPADVAPVSFFISFHQAFRNSRIAAPFGP